MADLLTRPLLRRDEPAWGSQVPWLAAIVAAGWVLVASLAITVLPGVAAWIGDGADAPVSDPLRFGARLWLAVHRIGLDVDGSDFTFAPLGLTIVVVLLMHRSARWAAHSAGVSTSRGAVAVVVPAVVTYLLGAGIIAGISATSEVASVPLEAVTWAGLWSAAAVTVGVAHESGLLPVWFGLVPAPVRACLAGGAAAIAALLAAGALLTAISAVVNSGRVGELAEALDAGAVGEALLALGGAAIVPNAVVWAVAFSLGPGFAVGAETSVAPGGVELGLVPAVPALGALPAAVPGPLTWLVMAGPLLAGVLAGFVVHRRFLATQTMSLGPAAAVAGGAGVVAAVGMAVLALLSGGTAGAGRLAEIGPVPWQVAAATLAFVSVPAAAVVLLLRVRGPAEPADAAESGESAEPADNGDTSDNEAAAPDQ